MIEQKVGIFDAMTQTPIMTPTRSTRSLSPRFTIRFRSVLCGPVMLTSAIFAAPVNNFPAPIAHWNCDEIKDGKVEGTGPASRTGEATGITRGEGKIGKALIFANPEARLTFPVDLNHTETNGVTVSLWFRADSSQGDYGQLFNDNGARGINLRLVHGKAISLGASNKWHLVRQEAGAIRPGEWVHVAATLDGKTARLYVDGKLIGEGDAPVQIKYANEIQIGYRLDAPSAATPETKPIDIFTGAIDEIKIFSVALDPQQVATLAASPS